MFAQSQPDDIVAILEAGGFQDIDAEPVEVTFTLGPDPDGAADYLASTGVGRDALDTVPDDQRPAALAAVRATFAEHLTDHGVQLRAAIWVTQAVCSA